jgi:hypothetical protein
MADLPELPDRVRRKLALLWDSLVEKHGFTGEHLKWTETRRRKIVTSASRPPVDIHSRTVRYIQERTAPVGPVYAHADTVGIEETGLLAVERFGQIAGEYFSLWVAEPGRCSDVFAAWLKEIQEAVAAEVGQLWTARGDWFQRVCRATVDTTLTPLIKPWKEGPREIEIRDLEEQQLRLTILDLQQKIARSDAVSVGTPEPIAAEPIGAPSADEVPGLLLFASVDEIKVQRRALLAEYKAATKSPSNKRIYEAKGSIHKPDFYAWLNGDLSPDSAMSINLERFLRLKKPPIPRKTKG